MSNANAQRSSNKILKLKNYNNYKQGFQGLDILRDLVN